MKHPNIVVFCTDEQPFDWLGCMGNPSLKTPNIDALAAQGTVFRNAYCNSPICMSSRAAMFTGLPGSVTGSRTNGIPLNHDYPTLTEILRDNGYQTFSTGKLHFSSWAVGGVHAPEYTNIDPKDHLECGLFWNNGTHTKIEGDYFGFQKVDFLGGHGWQNHGEYRNWLKEHHPDQFEKFVNRETCKPSLDYEDAHVGTYYSTMDNACYYNEWIKDRAIAKMDEADPEKPFFAWVSYPDPHWPFGPPAPYHSMYDPKEIPQPVAWDDDKASMPDFYHKEWYEKRGIRSYEGQDTDRTLDQIMESKALSYGMTTAIDDSVGQVVEHLKQTGKFDDTVFIFLSDHGDAMGDHKIFNKGPFHYDSVIRVPMVVCYPKAFPQGQVSDAFVQLLDFMPTVLDLAGVPYPAPAIPDWQGFHPDNFPMYDDGPYSRLVGHSLVPVLKGEAESVQDYALVEDDDDLSRIMIRTLVCQDYKMMIFMNRDDGVLFDRKNDPEERHNLWDDPAYAQAKSAMLAKMNQAMLRHQYRGRRRISMA